MKLPCAAIILKIDLLTSSSLVIHRQKNMNGFREREPTSSFFDCKTRRRRETQHVRTTGQRKEHYGNNTLTSGKQNDQRN
jgi:hypothetical protein